MQEKKQKLKMDKSLVTHISAELHDSFIRLVEIENLRGADTNNSAYLKSIIEKHIGERKREYQLLSQVFKEIE